MEAQTSLASFALGGFQSLEAPFWSSNVGENNDPFAIPGQNEFEDIRFPKKRRYCGEDTSRHSWDNRGLMSTEPPTPVLLEQQEPVDSESIFPQAVLRVPEKPIVGYSRPQEKLRLPEGAVSHRKHLKGGRSAEATPGSTAARVKWCEEDDRLLIQLVSECGHNWPLIATKMEGRTSKQVKERWTNQLDPAISTDPWTAEDDQLLVELIRELGHSWCEISRRMRGRTESMVKNRFHANLRKRFGMHIFDPSVPLPPLTFKPKSLKSKKTVLSDEVRQAATVAAEKAAALNRQGSRLLSVLPMMTGSYSPSSETSNMFS